MQQLTVSRVELYQIKNGFTRVSNGLTENHYDTPEPLPVQVHGGTDVSTRIALPLLIAESLRVPALSAEGATGADRQVAGWREKCVRCATAARPYDHFQHERQR